MKMKLWDRVILFLGALLCLGAGAWLAVDGIAWMLNTADSMAMWVRAAKAALGDRAIAAPSHMAYIRPSAACEIASVRADEAKGCMELTPIYLRAPQAERERNARLKAEGAK